MIQITRKSKMNTVQMAMIGTITMFNKGVEHWKLTLKKWSCVVTLTVLMSKNPVSAQC